MQSKPYSKTHRSASYFERCSVEFAAATSVVAMNGVDVVALNAIFVSRFSKTRRIVGWTDSQLDGWSVGRSVGRSVGSRRSFGRSVGKGLVIVCMDASCLVSGLAFVSLLLIKPYVLARRCAFYGAVCLSSMLRKNFLITQPVTPRHA